MAADSVFLDTNVLVAASAEAHPSHAMAAALVASLVADRVPLAISAQVCREFLSVMTRQPLGAARALTVAEARAAIEGWRRSCAVLKEDDAVQSELVELVRGQDVKGKQVHDANIVATMRANGIDRLATLNAADFKRFEDEIAVEPFVS
jgi:predicted nucleic acid-binding protein